MNNAELFAVFGGKLSSEDSDEAYLQIMRPFGQASNREIATFQVITNVYNPSNPNNEIKDLIKERHSKREQVIEIARPAEQSAIHEKSITN